MGLFSKKDAARSDQPPQTDLPVSDNAAGNGEITALEKYKVIYRGGHPDLPKSKTGEIKLLIMPDAFIFEPTIGSKKFWKPLTLAYSDVYEVTVAPRQVSTFEGLAGGLDSRQLNQNNNLHFSYVDGGGSALLLRMEMMTGVTVMGQARKCREFEDRLRNLGILPKFRTQDDSRANQQASVAPVDIPDQIAKLAQLRDAGVLSDAEFEAKKADLLHRL